MMKTQIGLGVLSIPGVFDVLGIVPGVIALCCIAAITTWSDYIVGVFKLRHPEVYGIDDVGRLLFGRVGREFFGIVFCLCKFSNRGKGNSETNHSLPIRLDLRCRLWHARCLDRTQLGFPSRCMHGWLRRHCRSDWFLLR